MESKDFIIHFAFYWFAEVFGQLGNDWEELVHTVGITLFFYKSLFF